MIVPNIRDTKTITPYLSITEENAYYQGYLKEEDANYIAGYDACVNEFENYLYNLDILEDAEILGELRRENWDELYSQFLDTENTDNEMDIQMVKSPICRLLLTLARGFFEYAEGERNMMGVSILDNMSEEEYDKQVKKCKNGYKNILMRLEAHEKGE